MAPWLEVAMVANLAERARQARFCQSSGRFCLGTLIQNICGRRCKYFFQFWSENWLLLLPPSTHGIFVPPLPPADRVYQPPFYMLDKYVFIFYFPNLYSISFFINVSLP
jgi:hypothetical protein